MTPSLLALWSMNAAFFVAALLSPVDCAAAPAIASTGGTFQYGASITVSGSGFGTKPQAAPTAFETLESGGFLPYWSNTTGLTIASGFQRTAHSEKTAYHNFKSGTGNDVHNAYLTGSNSILSPSWFVSYWVYLDPNFDWQNGVYPNPPKFLSNVKIFRLWNPGSTQENFVMATQGWGKNVIATNENTGGLSHWGLNNYPSTHLAPGTWHHLQFAYKENSALGAADGQLLMWVDGRQVMNHADYITRLKDDVLKRPYIVGFYNSWSPGEGTPDPSDMAPNELYLDDVYVDTSCARVELGDHPVYADCTHRELQLPTAWAPAALAFTLNLGSFADNATAYLFVVDSDNVASPGHPVLLGSGSADTIAPTSPTGLTGTAPSSTAVRLAWTAATDNVGVTGYRIYRDGLPVGTVPATTFTDTGLAAGTTYNYAVAANDEAGNSSAPSSPNAVTTAAPLHAPLWIDFNDANNYTQQGYTGIGPVVYNSARSMGWDLTPSARSRWSYEYQNLYRDAHHGTADRTFKIDVPNGRYTVRLYFLGALLAANDNDRLQVFTEGHLALDLPTLPRDPYMTRILRTEVADGQLELRFHDDGGAGTTWCVSGLSVIADTGWPEIDQLSTSSARPGERVVVEGSAFGTRPAAPVIWEDFESGTAGTSLATGGWSVGTSANIPPIYTNELTYSGGRAGMADFPSGTVTQSTCCAYKSGLSLDEVYVSYHVFIRRNSGVQTRNLKLLRVHSGTIDFLHGDPNIGMTNQNAGGQSHASGETSWSSYVEEGSWHRIELYAKLSAVDQYDGAWEGVIDQRPISFQDRSMLAKSSYPTNRFRFVALPIYCAHDEGGDYDVFYDDLYVDSTRARVEVGDTPDWHRCTKREIQCVTDWSPASIGFTVRPGLFREGDLMYVFVVDAAGNASEGIPMVLAAAAPTTFAAWRTANFTGADLTDNAISGPNADPDGCGLSNLARYSFGLTARGPVANPIDVGTSTSGGASYLTLTFPRRNTAEGLTYTLESSTDLVTWTTVPDRTYTAGSGPITARDAAALGSTPRRFLRLRITQQ